MASLDTRWFSSNLSAKDKDRRTKEVMSFKSAFQELDDLISQLEATIQAPDYDSPSWAYKQADVNGANRKLQEIRNIIRNGILD